MYRRIVISLIIGIYFLINTSTVFAQTCDSVTNICEAAAECNPRIHTCVDGYSCQSEKLSSTGFLCQKDAFGKIFGKIQPPNPIKGLISNDATGTGGINQFLSNLVKLFYSVAAVVLIFMLLWGAFDWMISGGDKEKIESARRRIISAIIGIILFAVTFAVIQILGNFTGFKFFVGQK